MQPEGHHWCRQARANRRLSFLLSILLLLLLLLLVVLLLQFLHLMRLQLLLPLLLSLLLMLFLSLFLARVFATAALLRFQGLLARRCEARERAATRGRAERPTLCDKGRAGEGQRKTERQRRA